MLVDMQVPERIETEMGSWWEEERVKQGRVCLIGFAG